MDLKKLAENAYLKRDLMKKTKRELVMMCMERGITYKGGPMNGKPIHPKTLKTKAWLIERIME